MTDPNALTTYELESHRLSFIKEEVHAIVSLARGDGRVVLDDWTFWAIPARRTWPAWPALSRIFLMRLVTSSPSC